MILKSLIEENKDTFIEICRKHKVNTIYAFGSAITDRFDTGKSDVDLVVDLDVLDPIEYGGKLLSLWNSLELFFNRKVDMLTEESIRNPYLRKSIESTKKLIYDRQREKVFV